MKNTLRLLAAATLLAALAGCGNKGPLMHPTAPADELPVPASTAPATPATTALATPVEPAPVPPADGGG